MKNCISCGTQLDDNDVFCVLCGTKQDAVIPPPSYQTPPQPSFAPSAIQVNSTLSARSILYKHGASSLFFSAVILYTISAVVIVINLLVILNDIFSVNGGVTLSSAKEALKGKFYLACIPTVLYCIGLWLFTKNCRKKGTSSIGLTIMRSVTVAMVVLSAIGFVSVLLLIGLMYISFFRLALYANKGGVLFLVFILAAAILILPFVFNIKLVKSITKIRLTLRKDVPHTISRFIPVMLIIASVFQFFSSFYDFKVIEFIFTVITLAANIIFARCISAYNREMQVIKIRNNLSPQPPSNKL